MRSEELIAGSAILAVAAWIVPAVHADGAPRARGQNSHDGHGNNEEAHPDESSSHRLNLNRGASGFAE